MLNTISYTGRLTKDVSLRYSPQGTAIASYTVAVNRPFTNQQGEREADFINTVQFKRGAENTANFCKKGDLVGVTGRLQTRNYQNNEGKTVWVTEVVAENVAFLETRGGQSNNQSNNQNNQSNNDDPFGDNGEPISISDDDLPF